MARPPRQSTGSHVIGRIKNDHYVDKAGTTVLGFSFTVEDIDYLDSRAEGEKRRRQTEQGGQPAPAPVAPVKAAKGKKTAKAGHPNDDDIPF